MKCCGRRNNFLNTQPCVVQSQAQAPNHGDACNCNMISLWTICPHTGADEPNVGAHLTTRHYLETNH